MPPNTTQFAPPPGQATSPRIGSAPHDSPGSADDAIVQVRDLHKSFGSLRVLRGMNLDFQRGHNTVILGPSGTGKSVLLKHIVGLLRPDKGEVHFDGRRVDKLKDHDLVSVRKKIGFLFQMGALFDSKNVHDNIAFPLMEHADMSRDEREEAVNRVLKMVGLPDVQKKMPADLSGGQRKRVALARAIVFQPDLVLYDEPTTGLDPITSDVINELIIALREKLNITGIAVTHDIASAKKIADRMVLLYDGKVVADGPTQAFLESDNEVVQRFIQGRAEEDDLKAIRKGFETPGGAEGKESKGEARPAAKP